VWLLPPSLHDFVPVGHPVVRGELDLSRVIVADYDEARGPAALSSDDDGGAPAVRLPRASKQLAADRQGARSASTRWR